MADLTGLRIAVLGSRTAAGSTLVGELQRLGHRVVGLDTELPQDNRVGYDVGLLPAATTHDFRRVLVENLDRRRIDMLIPATDQEIRAVILLAEGGESLSAMHWLNGLSEYDLLQDKLALCRRARDLGLPVVEAWSPMDVPWAEGHWIVKPRTGCGSVGVVAVDGRATFDKIWDGTPVVVQRRAFGREFSADCLVDRQSNLVGAVLRFRNVVREGVCVQAETFESTSLVEALHMCVKRLNLTSFVNIQGIISPSGPAVFEINPRFSGGIGASLAAGADLVGQYLLGVLGRQMSTRALEYRSGEVYVRHDTKYTRISAAGKTPL